MLFLRAYATLMAYSVLNWFCPFEVTHRTVKKWKVANRRCAVQDTIAAICKAVNFASIWYPLEVRCLQRSFAITYLLRKCGVAAQMVLGAQKLPFRAHAWVEVDGQAINERSDVQSNFSIWERC
jgi:hypothetical protein